MCGPDWERKSIQLGAGDLKKKKKLVESWYCDTIDSRPFHAVTYKCADIIFAAGKKNGQLSQSGDVTSVVRRRWSRNEICNGTKRVLLRQTWAKGPESLNIWGPMVTMGRSAAAAAPGDIVYPPIYTVAINITEQKDNKKQLDACCPAAGQQRPLCESLTTQSSVIVLHFSAQLKFIRKWELKKLTENDEEADENGWRHHRAID